MLNNCKSLGKLLLVKASSKRFPLSVTHIITTKCNFRCSYCNMWKHDEKEMTTEQVFKMLDEFKEMGLQRYGLSGGEPLLRQDIGEIVSYAKSKGMIVTVFTNGSLLPAKIGLLKDVDVLLMSFDGPREVHDQNRQPGAYDAVIKAIQLARSQNIPVWGGVTLTKNNVDHVEEILETAKKLDFSLLIQPVYVYRGYSAPEEQIKDMSEFGDSYQKAIDLLIQKKKEGYPLLNSYTYLKCMKDPHNQAPNKPCYAAKTYCAITPGGKVSPCYKIYSQQDWPSGVDLGFKNAFLSLPQNLNCEGCFSYATTENNLFYSLVPEVVYNTYFKMIRKSR